MRKVKIIGTEIARCFPQQEKLWPNVPAFRRVRKVTRDHPPDVSEVKPEIIGDAAFFRPLHKERARMEASPAVAMKTVPHGHRIALQERTAVTADTVRCGKTQMGAPSQREATSRKAREVAHPPVPLCQRSKTRLLIPSMLMWPTRPHMRTSRQVANVWDQSRDGAESAKEQ